MIELRPHQVDALDMLRANMRAKIRRQILSAPTGCGKTEVGIEIIKGVLAKGTTCDFVCDRRPLVRQTSERFWDAGIEHGILMGEDSWHVHKNVRVSSAQTIQSRGLLHRDLFVVDECHEIRPSLLEAIRDSGAWLIGMTATPFPPELADFYQAVVTPISTRKLIQQGWLCPFEVVAPVATIDTDGLPLGSGGEWQKEAVSKRVLRIVGEVVPEWERRIAERYEGIPQPTVVFAASIDDAEALAREFRSAGYDFRVVSSRESDDDNKDTLERFNKGEFIGIVNCAILSRGWDAPATVILVDAYPLRRSLLTLIQRYGRVMRIFEGKTRATVIDHAENWIYFRDDILEFYQYGVEQLGGDRYAKSKRAKAPEAEIICRKCRQVFESKEIRVCPNCGEPRPDPPTREGQRRKLRVVSGRLEVIDEITGEIEGPFKGDAWPHMCAHALRACNGDEERAAKRAQASHKSIFGRFTRRSFELPPDGVAPDAAIGDLMRRNFQAYIIAKRAARKKAAERARAGR